MHFRGPFTSLLTEMKINGGVKAILSLSSFTIEFVFLTVGSNKLQREWLTCPSRCGSSSGRQASTGRLAPPSLWSLASWPRWALECVGASCSSRPWGELHCSSGLQQVILSRSSQEKAHHSQKNHRNLSRTELNHLSSFRGTSQLFCGESRAWPDASTLPHLSTATKKNGVRTSLTERAEIDLNRGSQRPLWPYYFIPTCSLWL